jgi:hypothetical protein
LGFDRQGAEANGIDELENGIVSDIFCKHSHMQTLSQESKLSESLRASFRRADLATVSCKNQTVFSLRKEPLWRSSISPSTPRSLRHSPKSSRNPTNQKRSSGS